MKLLFAFILSVLTAASTAFAADKEPTAFELIKEGNRYVGEQSKDRVIQIRSERSIGSLTPKIWSVFYYDPTATFKVVEVKFAAGRMIDVKRPFRPFDMGDSSKELDREKLKIDSDAAIATILKEPILENIKVKSVEAKLENGPTGPVWRIKLWAEKMNGRDITDIGRMTVTADDAKVIETDIHLNRLG